MRTVLLFMILHSFGYYAQSNSHEKFKKVNKIEFRDSLFILYTVKEWGKNVFDNIYSGNTDKIWEQLKGTWLSLPGGSQEGIKKPQAESFFKEAVKNELNGVTSIATPQGSLVVPQKK
jgi:hypothetical protein